MEIIERTVANRARDEVVMKLNHNVVMLSVVEACGASIEPFYQRHAFSVVRMVLGLLPTKASFYPVR